MSNENKKFIFEEKKEKLFPGEKIVCIEGGVKKEAIYNGPKKNGNFSVTIEKNKLMNVSWPKIKRGGPEQIVKPRKEHFERKMDWNRRRDNNQLDPLEDEGDFLIQL